MIKVLFICHGNIKTGACHLFSFGGSDIVMIFQNGISLKLATREHVLMGEPYAEAVSVK